MVCGVLCPKRDLSLEELKDPIDMATGFRIGLRAVDLEGGGAEYIRKSNQYIHKMVKDLSDNNNRIRERIDRIASASVFGRKVDMQRYLKVWEYVGCTLSAAIATAASIGSKYLTESQSSALGVVSGALVAGISSFTLAIKSYQINCEHTEKILLLLEESGEKLKESFQHIQENLDKGDCEGALLRARKSTEIPITTGLSNNLSVIRHRSNSRRASKDGFTTL